VSPGAISTPTAYDARVTCDNCADISPELLQEVAESHDTSKAHMLTVSNGVYKTNFDSPEPKIRPLHDLNTGFIEETNGQLWFVREFGSQRD